MVLQQQEFNVLPLPVGHGSDSSEIMRGNLVLVQNSTSSSAMPSSPSSSARFLSQTWPSMTSPSRSSKRLMAVVKVYRKSGKHFAVVSFVGRQQVGRSPMYVNLKKYNVRQARDSNQIVLSSMTIEGSSLTFEATTSAKASKWMQAFGKSNQSSGSLRDKAFGNRHVMNMSPTSIMEEICEEASESDSTTSNHSVDNRLTESKELWKSSILEQSTISSSVSKSLPSSFHSSHQISNTSGVSRKPHLPVLSESEEEEEEGELSADVDCSRFCVHRLE